MFRVTRSPPSSGSWTVRRAARTAASVMTVIGLASRSCADGRREDLCHARAADIVPAARPRACGAGASGPAARAAARRASTRRVPTRRALRSSVRGASHCDVRMSHAQSRPGSDDRFVDLTPRPARTLSFARRRGGARTSRDATPGASNLPSATIRPAAWRSPAAPCLTSTSAWSRSPRRSATSLAVDHIDLEVVTGEFFSLLGPVGLRQDDDPAHDRRLRAADLRA